MSRKPWPIPVLWPGETAVVIAGGPSLSLAQVRRVGMAKLEGKCHVIAVNDAVFLAWWADWLHACDGKWWLWHRNTATKFPGIRTTLTETVPEAWAKLLLHRVDKDTGYRGGFPEGPDMIAAGGNGGYQAIQIAVKAGAKKVILLGFDMKSGNTKDGDHWFGAHQDDMRSDYENTMIPWFWTLVEPLRQRCVEVLNATPGSALECFPMVKLEEVL